MSRGNSSGARLRQALRECTGRGETSEKQVTDEARDVVARGDGKERVLGVRVAGTRFWHAQKC